MGGAERVAANLCTYSPEQEFDFHYLVFEGYENYYGPEIEAHGGKVITIAPPSAGYCAYYRRLAKLIRSERYCVVHSHTMFNSGINLFIAKIQGVPTRIAHSHTTKTETRVTLLHKCYEQIMRWIILLSATDLLACGVEAGEWMYGRRAFSRRGCVIRNGIDTDAFAFSDRNRYLLRTQFGFSDNDFVIGHSGALIPLKNQEFLIRLMPRIIGKKPSAKLLLLGGGDKGELERLRSIANQCGVSDIVFFCGGVNNVNEYLSAMDVFAFPSCREGTPLALIEAQANGLPCIISNLIPDDALLTDLVHPLSLDDDNAWIEALIHARRYEPAKYSSRIEAFGYSIKASLVPIYRIYRRHPC